MNIDKKIHITTIIICFCVCLLVTFANNCFLFAKLSDESITQTQNVNINTDMEKDEGKINLNSCSLEELKSLRGVSDKKALLIINNRPYVSVWDLSKIDGIGETLIRNIKDEVIIQ